ncbi:3'(2'),5'-bisphosphate nucleotidase CysQ [Candidatus Woesearchaeota archaeon]|nr:3'(2'),5'-bisphosphate nucleotidase CysQ [Candidatus Woesearchaeota archaeon]
MLEKIIDITVCAGKIVMKMREDGLQTETKSDSFDFVTSADIESEKYIMKRLSEEFPKDSILSEEKGMIKKGLSRVWMVDPLDGTKDFKNGRDGFSIMIGLCENGKPILGVVYAPAKNLLYFSQKGQGSYVRIDGKDHKLKVSKTKYLKDAAMVTRIPHGEKREEDKIEEIFIVKKKIPESSVGIKLGLIASHEADFHINTNFRANKWDTCAPQIILEEAGGKVTDLYGNSLSYTQSDNKWLKSFVASNKVLHEDIIKKIKESYLKKLNFS